MTQKAIDIEEIIKTDHLYATDAAEDKLGPGKLQIEVIEVTLHGAMPHFYMACSGCQWRDCLVHGGILFRVVHAVCLATNNSSKQTLQIFATCPSKRSETHDGP